MGPKSKISESFEEVMARATHPASLRAPKIRPALKRAGERRESSLDFLSVDEIHFTSTKSTTGIIRRLQKALRHVLSGHDPSCWLEQARKDIVISFPHVHHFTTKFAVQRVGIVIANDLVEIRGSGFLLRRLETIQNFDIGVASSRQMIRS